MKNPEFELLELEYKNARANEDFLLKKYGDSCRAAMLEYDLNKTDAENLEAMQKKKDSLWSLEDSKALNDAACIYLEVSKKYYRIKYKIPGYEHDHL